MSYIRTGRTKIAKIQMSPRINLVLVLGLWGLESAKYQKERF
jgi:hypothetical protein